MTIDLIDRMESLLAETVNQEDVDTNNVGKVVWEELGFSLSRAISYQRKRRDERLAAAYGEQK